MKTDTISPAALEREVENLRAALAQARADLAAAQEQSRADAARQHRYAAIVEASHDAIWSWDMDGTLRSWNAEAERLFGYRADEILGKSLFVLVPAERRALARAAVDRLHSGDWLDHYQTERLHKDGTPVPVELTVSPIRDTAGAIVGAATVCRDITERRQFEERFRLMSEHAPVMIWMSDPNGGCLHLNRMLRDFWNVAETDLATFDWRTSMHPEDAPEIGRQMMDALAKQSSVTIKGRYRHADGRYRLLETDARPRFSPQGAFLGMIGVNVDITEREEAEEALRDSEERFRLAVEAAPSGMVMTDADGRILMVNAHAEILFGYGRDEMIGQPIEMLVPQPFRKAHPGFRAAYRENASARPMGAGRDLFALHKDGSEIPVEIGLSPIVAPDGLMTLAAVVDISGRKEAESHRELLLAELNHRVKNTLAVVQSIANQTFKGARASPEAKRAFEGRLIALSCAHDLLTRSNWENAALEDLAADTLHARGVQERRIEIKGPRVLLSPRQALGLAMALHELATNAAKYGALSNDTGRVELSWARTGTPPRLTLTWRERGGPPVARPKKHGFGSLLLERALAKDLDGEVVTAFDPDGLTCTIAAPLANV